MARTGPGACLVALLLGVAGAGCVRKPPDPPRGVLIVSQEQQASWVRNFNPLTTASAARWPTLAGDYEPQFVFNRLTSG
jgi:peptide/nickel transport system substrate-binding protein